VLAGYHSRTTCTPDDGQLGRNMYCPIKEYEERIVNDIARRRTKAPKVRSIQCNRMLKYNTHLNV
jgi:hypothetical protein